MAQSRKKKATLFLKCDEDRALRDSLSLHHCFQLGSLKGWRLQSSEISAMCLIVDVGTDLSLAGGGTLTCGTDVLLLDLFTG